AQKNLEKPDAKIAAAQEKKEQQSLVKARAKCPAVAAAETAQEIPRTEKVVDLSGNMRTSTPPVEVNQPSLPREHDDAHVSPNFDVHSESSHQGNEEVSVANRYVPDWELRNDLRVCTIKTGKELVSHLATPAEDEFVGSLLNAEVISRAYQTLGQSVEAQRELLKRHE
ncbi:hypothetical protein Tco_1168638, partial [Tanacetum coccineum]